MRCIQLWGKNRWPEDERRALDQAIFDDVDTHKLDITWPLRESTCNVFMIDDNVTCDSTGDEFGVNVGLAHARGRASANLNMAGGEQFGGVFKLFCIWRICGEPCLNVLGVIGIELALNYNFGGGKCWHGGAKYK